MYILFKTAACSSKGLRCATMCLPILFAQGMTGLFVASLPPYMNELSCCWIVWSSEFLQTRKSCFPTSKEPGIILRLILEA